MREIHTETILQTVARLCQEANFDLGEDVLAALRRAIETEESPLARQVLPGHSCPAAGATAPDGPDRAVLYG